MKRGDLFRVRHPSGDPKKSRVFVIASRQVLIGRQSRPTCIIARRNIGASFLL